MTEMSTKDQPEPTSDTHSAIPLRTVAVTGGTGFVGGAVIEGLVERDYEVICLTRDTQRAGQLMPHGVRARKWLSGDTPSKSLLEDVDAVIHLAGAPAVGVRLTEAKKKLILDSRVETTKALVAAMKHLPTPPKVFISASAIGYYGPHDSDELLEEEAPAGDDFLARVCVEWERAALEAEALGVRVVRTRLGIVFGEGGPLEVMALPFRLFAGGPIAGGRQVVSWVDRRDVVRALCFCLDREEIQGPVNVCSPEAATNGEISEGIARILGRPNYLPVPKFGLKLLFGEGADPIIGGQRVVPRALERHGFTFEHADLGSCLRDHLAR